MITAAICFAFFFLSLIAIIYRHSLVPQEGFPGGGWGSGQGDVTLVADWSSLRWSHTHVPAHTDSKGVVASAHVDDGLSPWLWSGEAAPAGVDCAVMLCAIAAHHATEEVQEIKAAATQDLDASAQINAADHGIDGASVQPRDMLNRVLERARSRWGISVGAAGELEFYLHQRRENTVASGGQTAPRASRGQPPQMLSSLGRNGARKRLLQARVLSSSTAEAWDPESALGSPVPTFPCDYHVLPETAALYSDALQTLAKEGVHVEGFKG